MFKKAAALLTPRGWELLIARNAGTCLEGRKGLVLGVYEGCCPGEFKLTPSAEKFDKCVDGKITALLKGIKLKKNKAYVFGNVGDEFYQVAVSNLGAESAGRNDVESLDQCRENIRSAVGLGAIALQDQGITNIFVEEFTNAEAAAESAALAVWTYQDWKSKDDRLLTEAKIEPYGVEDGDGWRIGMLKADSQNIARGIEETPSNLMSPLVICRYAAELLCPCGVRVDLWDKNWLESNRFSALLSVAKGSCEPPALLQLSFCGGKTDEKPIVITGKNATFCAGGLNLRKSDAMSVERADVASAAVTIATFKAIAQMRLPINIVAMMALYEHMPSGMALKPGDVLMARNGKTILMEDVALSGRIVAADILTFLEAFQPCLVIHKATSNTSAAPAVGYPATGVWSTSDILWEEINRAGMVTGDRFWRFPIWKYFRTQIKENCGTDTKNRGKGFGQPQMIVPFLLEFAPKCVDLVHMDLTDTGRTAKGLIMPYLRKGRMTGRPTRPLIQFLYRVACPHDPLSVCC
ncbi:manganese ion Hypothetical protein [Nesidiocoris tenuis]|uniref:Cytosol aminopeptidase n=1 Tax=Nesidiocoris tenuis TaxID=355587 RepID=A0ABN7BEP0_9HEMI|nr:manganese ion Hypothetical protein [Nesidiocoris tenuis]